VRRLVATLLVLLAACGSEEADERAEAGEFIALPRDFAGYAKWWSVEVGEGSVDESHLGVKRRVYVNRRPEPGATSFPVGTILVKTGAGGELDGTVGHEVHAMVKRGGTFNAAQAVGWEWFELEQDKDAPGVVWRGERAPNGEGYLCQSSDPDGGVIEVDCNQCHTAGRQNDFVLGPELSLDVLAEP
jgi:hypothetical protein